VAGLVSLLFGVRRVWALRFPILFLLLAWPIPFTWLLSLTAVPLTDFTAGSVALITQVVPVARQAGGDDGTLFLIGSGGNMFGVGIGSACSGVNSFIGFLLLGVATLYLVHGTALRRVAWLATGLALIVALNLARIMAILVVGNAFGQEAALDILHPIAGLVVFNIGVLVMLILAPAFGLRYSSGTRGPSDSDDPGRPTHVRRVSAALVVAVGVAAVLGLTNAAYARYEAISSGLADARLARIDIDTAHVPGWGVSFVGNIGQARQYFGDSATWERVAYRPTPEAEITADRTVYVDVLTTDDAGTFAAYGLEACYTFHGFEISSVAQVDIGAGVQAEVIDYTNVKNDIEWSALWWEWPYTAETGETRYQRIVVYISDGPNATLTAAPGVDIPTQDPRFIETDRFLASLGRSIVDSQLNAAREGEPAAASVGGN
jgi:exosortase